MIMKPFLSLAVLSLLGGTAHAQSVVTQPAPPAHFDAAPAGAAQPSIPQGALQAMQPAPSASPQGAAAAQLLQDSAPVPQGVMPAPAAAMPAATGGPATGASAAPSNYAYNPVQSQAAGAADAASGASAPNGEAPVDGTAAAPVPAPVTEFSQSFFFKQDDMDKIRQALSGRLVKDGDAANYNIPAVRRIILSGIYYRGPGDWTIWMNGKKVTPQTLTVLPELVDINVVNNRVRLKWFDIGLNGIITLEMRPHQVYDIVTGVMLSE